MSVDVRTAQGARVHVPHSVLHVDRDRSVDRSDDLQDTQELHHSPGHDVRTVDSARAPCCFSSADLLSSRSCVVLIVVIQL